MNAYSPFIKELTELEAADLAALKEATEGWYIEYKREIPNAAAIAKSVSAFANTYGGWLFYGISEKSKEEAVAGEFTGVPRAEVDVALQRMRQAVATLVNPSPHFDTKVVWGLCAEIGLAEDHAVICVRIPWSPTAPHVHKSGQIYRRLADGSEPKPESDRFQLDQLWQRSKKVRKVCKEWVLRDPELSKGEEEAPYVRLMLSADLWRERDAWTDASIETVREILGRSQGTISATPFDTVYSSASGFIGRQTTNNDPHNMGLTWRFNPDLTSDVLLPLNFYARNSPLSLMADLDGYDGAQRFVRQLHEIGYQSPRVVDLNFLFNILVAVAKTYQKLLDTANWKHGYFMKARLINVWRTVPFVDVPIVLDRFERYGLPMVLDEVVTTPPSTDPETFAFIEKHDDSNTKKVEILLGAFKMFIPIARSFGIPYLIENRDEQVSYLTELQYAGGRARDVQSLRNERRSKGE